ncbi:hypothetical protein BASA81_012308 [Batrachochytrium salamandrivorans]|nr:hypothetical protein BASA81_012308 [Batrachochytrium salamandrivorans]
MWLLGVCLWNEIVRRSTESQFGNITRATAEPHLLPYPDTESTLRSGPESLLQAQDAGRSTESKDAFCEALKLLSSNSQSCGASHETQQSAECSVLFFEIYLGMAQLEWSANMKTAAFYNLNKSIEGPGIKQLKVNEINHFVRSILRLTRSTDETADKTRLCEMGLSVLECCCVDTSQSFFSDLKMLLWKLGDQAMQVSQWEDAISWYNICLTLISTNIADIHNGAVLYRKIALCYYELKGFDKALKGCLEAQKTELESDRPLTLFMLYIVYLEQNDTKQAMIPLDSRLDLYIQAAGVAHKKDKQGIVKDILKLVVSSGHMDWNLDTTKSQILTVLRCLIRLTKITYKNKQFFAVLVFKLANYWKITETYHNKIMATGVAADSSLFITTLGQLSVAHTSNTTEKADMFKKASTFADEFEAVLKSLSELDASFQVSTDTAVLQLLPARFEICIYQQQWEVASDIISKAKSVQASCTILEQLSDLVLRYDTPDGLAFEAIKAMLDEQMRHSSDIDILRFSSWYRTLVRISMHLNTDSILLFEQVMSLIKSMQSTKSYPKMEIKWLMISAWNEGCDQWSVHNSDGGRQWSEMALSLGMYVDDSEPLLDKMRASYMSLMDSTRHLGNPLS